MIDDFCIEFALSKVTGLRVSAQNHNPSENQFRPAFVVRLPDLPSFASTS
jgi:hypothetical protein